MSMIEDKWQGDNFCCGTCMRKDDGVHPLWPPKVKCEVTGRIHRNGDLCDCSYSQLKEYDQEHTINIDDVISPFLVDHYSCRESEIRYASSAWDKEYKPFKVTETEILVHRPDLAQGAYETFMTKEMFVEAFNKWIMETE